MDFWAKYKIQRCYNDFYTVIFMSLKSWVLLLTIFVLLLSGAVFFAQPVSASQPLQVGYQTPTPLPDGRIFYIVQENDSCLRIQLLTGVTVEQLRTLNKLDQDCTLAMGKELLLAIITPVPTMTTNPAVTATPLLPTATPAKGEGKICLLLYNDINGNGFQEETELLLDGGAVSITDREGKISKTGMTSANVDTPFCEQVPEGEYNISIAIPDGYNPTTYTSLSIPVQAGNQGFADFGAQISSKAPEPAPVAPGEPPPKPEENNLMLALMGSLLLILGIGLGIYAITLRRA